MIENEVAAIDSIQFLGKWSCIIRLQFESDKVMKTIKSLNLALCLLCWSFVSFAQEANLTLTDDAWTNGNKPNTNYGSDNRLFIHDFGPKQGYVRFDASPVNGTTITAATLTLLLRDIRDPGEVSVHAITSNWNEGTITAASQPTTEAAPVSIALVSPTDEGTNVIFDVTSLVQRWASGALQDFGILIRTAFGIRAVFDTKELSPGTAPMLSVFYESSPPPPPPPPPPGSGQGTPAIILDLSSIPVVIEEGGHYVLDRDWDVSSIDEGLNVVTFESAAFLDMREFSIIAEQRNTNVIRLEQGGTVINGTIRATRFGSSAVLSSDNLHLRNAQIFGENGEGQWAIVAAEESTIEDVFVSGGGIAVAGNSRIIGNDITCDWACLSVSGDNSYVTSNRIGAYLEGRTRTMDITGNNNVFTNNEVLIGQSIIGLRIEGNGNLVSENTFKLMPFFFEAGSLSPETDVAVSVTGTENLLKDNALPRQPFEIATGIRFETDGNFYGGNLFHSTTPFDLNGTVQTNTGGNSGL